MLGNTAKVPHVFRIIKGNTMNRLQKIRYPIKRVYMLDIFALICAFFAAMFIRYRAEVLDWNEIIGGFYMNIFVIVVLVQIGTLLAYDAKRAPIFVLDPVEIFINTFKSKIFFLCIFILYLFLTDKAATVSRIVVTALVVLDFLFDYVFRMIYRRIYNSSHTFNADIKVIHLRTPFPSNEELLGMLRKREAVEAVEVLIHQKDATDEEIRRVTDAAVSAGVRVYSTLDNLGYEVKEGISSTVSGYLAIPLAIRKKKYELFGVKYSVSKTEEAVLHVIRHIRELSGNYICFSNVHTTVMAKENPDYRDVLNGAAFVFPDGKPIVARQLSRGFIGAERVAGPDFMANMFRDTKDGKVTHYFYGASQKTLDALKENLEKKYPGIVIKGMYSPPFRDLTKEEKEADIKRINDAGADIVWIGLGAPKQEKWMAENKGKIHGVMMGVGAGFDFHAGTIKRAPEWIQKIGFEWLYRLFQDPGRLIRRYAITNAKYFFYLTLEKLKLG